MPFSPQVLAVLDAFGVLPATKAALFDLYVSLGGDVLEEFAAYAEGGADPSSIQPDVMPEIRARIVQRYVERNHGQWRIGRPTESLWRPRSLEGKAAGMARPIGEIATGAESDFGARVEDAVRAIIGDAQPVPAGLLVMGKNAHYGGRDETISFDVIAADEQDAVALALAEGQQHTLPGSVGETSGTVDEIRSLALLWEVQPNVYKPVREKNRAIAKIHRRHRNWHVMTLVTALLWLRERRYRLYVVRGSALAAAHEVNPAKPVTPAIIEFHDRSVARVVGALGGELVELADGDVDAMLESHLMNVGLRKMAEECGAAAAMQRIEWLEAEE
ncbi:MAG: hypothetical protein ACYC7A_02355 [Thermoanaerobaculia bacterium]